jgi:hypothetical protein
MLIKKLKFKLLLATLQEVKMTQLILNTRFSKRYIKRFSLLGNANYCLSSSKITIQKMMERSNLRILKHVLNKLLVGLNPYFLTTIFVNLLGKLTETTKTI